MPVDYYESQTLNMTSHCNYLFSFVTYSVHIIIVIIVVTGMT